MNTANLILGTAQLGLRYGIANSGGVPERKRAFAILDAAHEAGVGGIDTAPDYGEAEKWLGEFQQHRHTHWRITTKLPALPQALDPGALAQIVDRHVQSSLRKLHAEQIGRYLIHSYSDLERYGEALLAALEPHVVAGRIDQLGVSVYSPAEAEFAAELESLHTVQHPLNMLDRRLLQCALIRNRQSVQIQIEARSIFLQGILHLRPEHPAVNRIGATAALKALQDTTAAFGCVAGEIAVAWAFAAGADRVLIGVDNAQQLTTLVRSAAMRLPDGLLEAIDALPAPAASIIDPRQWPAT